MDQPRDDFLADAGLAGDQDLGVRPRGAVDLGLERADRIAPADEPDFLLSRGRPTTVGSFLVVVD